MAPNPNLQRLHDAGTSIWLDTLSRELLDRGQFTELIRDYAVTGATSNPTIFAKAITASDRYDAQLRALAGGGERDPQEMFFAIALDDVREAAHQLRPAFDASDGRDGFVSFECTPDLADDTQATIAQASALWQRLNEPNVMIKVPGTAAGLPAIEELTRRGINVNVTLLFAIERYEQAIDAFLRGLTARAAEGAPLDAIASVASFFVSRIDTKVDAQLARALVAERSGRDRQRARRLPALPDQVRRSGMGTAQGARSPDPASAVASTGTKDPAYSDVFYVSELIGPDVINTMPEPTLRAFADHGEVVRTLDHEPRAAERTLEEARNAGIDLDAVTSSLEREGVQSFCDSYHQLFDCIESKLGALAPASGTRGP